MKPKEIFVAKPQKSPITKKTEELLTELTKPLLIVKSFFPLDPFPDVLIINPVEVIYVNNIFFWSSYRTSMLIEEIGDIIFIEVPFFASLTITPTSTLKDEPIHIKLLTRGNARKAHDTLQGLITLKKEKIDIETLLKEKNGLEEIRAIGKAQSE